MEELLEKLPELSDEQIALLKDAFDSQYQLARDELMREQEAEAVENALNSRLEEAGALDIAIVRSVINSDNFIFDDGEFLGLDEEIARLKKEYAFLFRQDCPQFAGGFKHEDDVDIDSLNYLERLKFFKNNPEAYRQKCK